MDSLRIHDYKIYAIKKHKRQKFVGTILLYSLPTLACSLLCSSPLWYPSCCATFNAVFFTFIPKICSFFFTSKVLFIVGNLIVIFLVGESKFFAKAPLATYSDVCYDKYKCKVPESKVLSRPQVKTLELPIEENKVVRVDSRIIEDLCKCCRGEVRILENAKLVDEVSPPLEDLNKLADDFIARVNRQRRLEAEFFRS